MGIKISEIPGLLIEKKHMTKWEENTPDGLVRKGYNNAIDTQGAVEITMERENLAKNLHKVYYAIFMIPSEWEDLMEFRQEMFMEQADSLISNLPQLLVAVKTKGTI